MSNLQTSSEQCHTRPAPTSSPGDACRRVKEAAQYLRDRYGFGSASTLNKLRCSGEGPKFVKIGRKIVVYTTEALDTWALGLMREQRSTSDRK